MIIDDNYPLTRLLRGFLFEKRQLSAEAEAEYRRFAGMGSFGRYGLAALGHLQATARKNGEAEESPTGWRRHHRLRTRWPPWSTQAFPIFNGR